MPHQILKTGAAEADGWDTQQCEDYREELFPSSTNRVPDQVASTNIQVAIPSSPHRSIVKSRHLEQQGQLELSTAVEINAEAGADKTVYLNEEEDGNGPPDQFREPAIVEKELNPQLSKNTDSPRSLLQYRRDNRGSLRPFTSSGEEHRRSGFGKKYQELAHVQAAMDDFTQRSSMSATQENPAYIYDVYGLQGTIQHNCPSTTTPGDGDESEEQDPPAAPYDPKHASASTAYTYQENDAGHISLGFDTEPIEEVEESQDASYTMPAAQSYASLEPKTPAPPVNPFQQKGSVMKVSELFGATQTSSVGRSIASPTSSRPSPDVYNDFTSPRKHKTVMLSSPLGPKGGGLARELDSEANDVTPLHSSARNMLARSQSGNSRSAQSFNMRPRNTWKNPEPRPYVSMKESQEKRRQTQTIGRDLDSSGDDSDIEATRNKKMERELQIQKELATVGLRKKTTMNPRSSAPSSTFGVDVEVPSTGRRRSFQDDCNNQWTSHDARDTQQDDVIVDSQAAAAEVQEHDKIKGRADSSMSQRELARDLSSSGPIEEEVQQDIDADATQNTCSSDPEQDLEPEPEPSLPLQERLSNRSNMHTPSSKVHSDAVTNTIPETSPPENCLRPMVEIASISLGASEELPQFPGFTPDLEFDSVMQIRSSPRPPPRMRSLGRASSLASPMVHRNMSCLTSSALSSPPNSAILEQVEAEGSLQVAEEPLQASEEPTDEPMEEVVEMPAKETGGKEGTVQGNALPEETAGKDDANDDTGVQLAAPAINFEAGSVPEPVPILEYTPVVAKQAPPKRVAKTYSKKGSTARSLKRPFDTPATVAPRHFSGVAKMAPTPQLTPQSTTRSTPNVSEPSTVRKSAVPKQQTPQPAVIIYAPSNSSAANKGTSKRKSGVPVVHDDLLPTRSSKRQSIAKDTSPDPLALSSSTAVGMSPKVATGLFKDMTFAVSYVGHEREKDKVTKAIFHQGGRILLDGFHSLFESAKGDEEMTVSPSAKSVGFVALIADEHSRKTKYMQALALGLPCISGHWITACVAKDTIVDWSPYLLCAGQSSILGNAHKSRVLLPYPARDAKLEDTFANRDKLLEGKSILLVAGKGNKSQKKRKAYNFLAHALGPARISQVADFQDARKKLSQEEDHEWDLLYVEAHEMAEKAVFGPLTAVSASRKRKRGPTPADSPAPKKIRIISDEIMIQSLIFGQLLDD